MSIETAVQRLPLIGEDAPEFEADSTKGRIHFPQDYEGKWVVFFSHPADFTPVCTTEFLAFAAIQNDLRELNTELLALSVDSNQSHIAWLRAIKEKVSFNGMSGVEVDFPVIADLSTEVARKYGMLQPSASTTQAVRAVFVIDPKGKVRATIYYPLTNGRNMDEIKRLVTALQTTDEKSVSTPANWRPGDRVIVPPPTTAELATQRSADPGEGVECVDWFLCFKSA